MTTFDDFLKFWYDASIAKLYGSSDPGPGRVLLGCPVWGKDYTERLINFCLQSIMAAENLAALVGRARLVLFVDPTHSTDIAFHLKNLELEQRGIEIRLFQIPEEIIAEWRKFEGEAKRQATYKMLGAAQDILVQMAGRNGLDFHPLQPDHLYNARYFPNYFRLTEQHDAIGQIGICADIDQAEAHLDRFRQSDGSLAIPDIELGNIAFRNIHHRMKAFVMNDASIPDRMPPSHFMIWQGRDNLFLASCHMNAAHLSAKLCAGAPSFLGATMDACLPALMKGTTCYVPSAKDGLTFAELSGRNHADAAKHVPFELFSKQAWAQARFRLDYLWYTQHLCEIPIKPQTKALPDEVIRAQHKTVIDMLLADRGTGAALRACEGSFRREDASQ